MYSTVVFEKKSFQKSENQKLFSWDKLTLNNGLL